MDKKIVIMGSTGSIGRQSLAVIEHLGPEYKVLALTAANNYKLLAEQINKFKPEFAAIADEQCLDKLKDLANSEITEIDSGQQGIIRAACWPDASMVIMAQSGFSGFESLVKALQAGRVIALANKEALVSGGEILQKMGLLDTSRIYPIDSEHSAIWQCMANSSCKKIKKVILTASGGPFFGMTMDQLRNVTPEEALKHPNWSMGKKISIDSATMMNKGLEVIEAKWLFDLNLEQIEVVIHRQSIVHSMVEYIDGSIIAHLGATDMRIPIQYALTYPERKESAVSDFSLVGKNLTFSAVDTDNFPSLGLAYRAAEAGGTMTTVLNGANEVAVDGFLKKQIKFTDIADVVKAVLNRHKAFQIETVNDIIKADQWSRKEALTVVGELRKDEDLCR